MAATALFTEIELGPICFVITIRREKASVMKGTRFHPKNYRIVRDW